jgi:hypothetical protein
MTTQNVALNQYCLALDQRNLFVKLMSGLNPSGQRVRQELDFNAGGNIAQNQLQMRRKAEVLQYRYRHQTNYSSTNTSSKTNYNRLAKNLRGVSRRSCPDSGVICNSSSAAGVPGRPVTLCYDPSVPYIKLNSLNDNNPQSIPPYNSYDLVNGLPYIPFPMNNIRDQSNNTTIAHLVILNGISKPSSTINVTVPISYSVNISGNYQYTIQLFYSTLLISSQTNTTTNNNINNNIISVTFPNISTKPQDVYTIKMSISPTITIPFTYNSPPNLFTCTVT